MSEPREPAENFDALREEATNRAEVLLKRLKADQADLFQRRTGLTAVDTGLEAIARAVQAAERVQKQLQGG